MTGTAAVDYRWVMEVTFVVTVLVGAPMVALASVLVPLDDWPTRMRFAATVAAGVWFATAVIAYAVARRRLTPRRGGDAR